MVHSPDNCRAVADSNVIIAAQRSPHAQSPNRELLNRWRLREFEFLYSADTLGEYAEKLLRTFGFVVRWNSWQRFARASDDEQRHET